MLVKAKFKDVVLGARVVKTPDCAQKVDEPISDRKNKYGQSYNCTCGGFHKPDEIVQTPDYSIKSTVRK